MSDPRIPWLGFHLTKGIGPSRIERLLDHFGPVSSVGSIVNAWIISSIIVLIVLYQ